MSIDNILKARTQEPDHSYALVVVVKAGDPSGFDPLLPESVELSPCD